MTGYNTYNGLMNGPVRDYGLLPAELMGQARPQAPGLIVERCNPYGHTTGRGGDRGPRHLGGGLWPAAYEGAKKWRCENRADGWYVMTCRCGHKGQRMPLCYGHVEMIGRRQSGVCPPCVMPPEALELYDACRRAQADVVALHLRGADEALIRRGIDKANDLGLQMTDLVLRGIAHRCRLTLTEVS